MNITQLKYFHAVATYHTVSLAAQHLYISQPSLSNAIAALEKEFSVSLFFVAITECFLPRREQNFIIRQRSFWLALMRSKK